MKKILLIGHTPPPYAEEKRVDAANYRTWQFLSPLMDAGIDVCLCVPGLDLQKPNISFRDSNVQIRNGLSIVQIPFNNGLWIKKLQKTHDSYKPDCVAAINFDAALFTTRLRTNKPIWMDIYGDYLTIFQAAKYRTGSNRGLPTTLNQVKSVLRKGDVFSVCSTPQEHVLVGELAMVGRLSYQNFAYPFTRVILPGSPPIKEIISDHERNKLLKQLGLNGNEFIVLWCGGYNTWADVDTLFLGLSSAMERNPEIHFLSIGASTYQAADTAYDKFTRLIRDSPYRDRFHLLGWLPWNEVSKYYLISQVGVNIDAYHYETIYGTRTRIVEMIASGLPIITTSGTEISYMLYEKGAGFIFDYGDWDALSEHILSIAQDNVIQINMSQNASDYSCKQLSFGNTTLPFLQWLEKPERAPDNLPLNKDDSLQALEYKSRSILRQLIWWSIGKSK
jgi:glycosyltransferase involved in cell wall biosynthesis